MRLFPMIFALYAIGFARLKMTQAIGICFWQEIETQYYLRCLSTPRAGKVHTSSQYTIDLLTHHSMSISLQKMPRIDIRSVSMWLAAPSPNPED